MANKKYTSERQKKIIEQVQAGTYETTTEKKMKQRNENLRKQQAQADIAPVQQTAKTSDIAPVKTDNEQKWYQKILKGTDAFNKVGKAFDDGYQFGDIAKTTGSAILGTGKVVGSTVADIGLGAVKGVVQTGEGIGKLLVGGVAQVADWTGNDEYANKVRNNLATKDAPVSTFISKGQDKIEGGSVIGDTGDKVSEAIGYIGSIWASGGAGTATMFTSSTGNTLQETYKKAKDENKNVEDWQVWTKAIGTGLVETATEKLGGFFGTSGFDTKIINKIIPKISSGAGKVLTRLGVQSSTEMFEEFLSYAGSQGLDYMIDVANTATGGDGMKLKEDWNWEEVGEQMAVAFMASGALGGGANVAGIADVKNQGNLNLNEAVNEYARQQDVQGQSENLSNEINKLEKQIKKTTDAETKAKLQEELNWKVKQYNALQGNNEQQIPTAEDIQAIETEQRTQELQQLKAEQEAELKQTEDPRKQQLIQEELQVIDEELNNINAQQITEKENVVEIKPITNDNQGREISKELQTELKDVKTVDENGNLKTYYHGTRGEFDVFDNSKIGQNYEGDWSSLGKGIYFTDNYESAKEFGESSINEGETTVKEAYLDIKNPYYVDSLTNTNNYEQFKSDLQAKYGLEESDFTNGYTLIDALKNKGLDSTEVLKEHGYDGIIADDEVMVFDSNQIKNTNKQETTVESKQVEETPVQDAKKEENAPSETQDVPTQEVMTEEEYLSSKGYPFMGYTEAGLHKTSKNESTRSRKQAVELVQDRATEYDNKREELRKEYQEKVESGEIRKPNSIEKALKTAQGNEDNSSVQSARRLLEKRGIDWKTGEKINTENTEATQIKQTVEEAIAPLQETINTLTEQIQNIVPVAEQQTPVQKSTESVQKQTELPTQEELDNLFDIKKNKGGSEYASAFYALRDKYGQANLYKGLNQYYSTGTVVQPSNESNIDIAPTSQAIVEQQSNIDSLVNEEAPIGSGLTTEETQELGMYEDFISENSVEDLGIEDRKRYEYLKQHEDLDTTPVQEDIAEVKDPFENRDIKDVGNKKVKAYQYENPEVKPYFQNEAQIMLQELSERVEGKRYPIIGLDGYMEGYTGEKRVLVEDIAEFKDQYNYSYAEIEKGLNDIIKDEGSENNAVAKRLEFLINDRLLKGYKSTDGTFIPANNEYVNFVKEKQITQYSEEAYNEWSKTLDNIDIPIEEVAPTIEVPVETNENTPISNEAQEVIEEVAPVENITENVNTEPKTLKVDKSIAPTQETSQNPNTELTDSIEEKRQEEFKKIAKVLTEKPTAQNQKQRAWAKFRASFLDKGSVFEDLSLKTKNRELMAKWDNLMIANAKAQHAIGSGVQTSNTETKVMEQKSKSLDSMRETVVNSGKIQEFSEYMYHMLNTDRMSLDTRMGEGNKPVFGESVTAEQSRQIAQEFENNNPEFAEWANDIYEYNRALRDVLVENGVISQQKADYFEQKYPHYVPIQRVDVNGNAINVPLDTNRTGINTPIKKATGGNSDIMPLFDTLASRTFQTYRASSKNSFGVELKNALKSENKVEQTSLEGILDSVEDQESLLQEGKNGQSPTFTVFENGQKVTYEITQDMYDALKPVSDSSFLSTTIKPLNAWSNFKRGVLTQYNPLFSLTNSIKDFQDVLINSQHPAKTYAKFGESYAQILSKGYWYQEYMANGGEQNSYFDSQDGFDHKVKGVERITEFLPLKAISAVNDVIETAPRLAEYIASREAGRSIEVSMLDASRVTTNFKAGGDVTKWANRNGFTFLNASIQGLNQNIRNVREAHSQGLKGYLNLATKFAIAGAPALLLNALLWDDDEEYEELSDYVKQNYYVVGKMEDGTFIRIPKGRMSAVLQEGANQMANLITGNDEVDLGAFLEVVANNLAPNNPIENNIFSPFIQVANNKTWYGEDLVPTRLQDEPVEQQYDESTDKFSIWLGQKLGVSPMKINYLLDQNLGGIGDVLLPMGTAQAESSTENKILAPFVNKFTTNSTLNNQNISDFYKVSEELTSKSNSVEATDEDILKNKYMNSVKGEMSELYKEKREIQANELLSDTDKYNKVLKVQSQINDLAKVGLNSYENINNTDSYANIGNREYYKNINKDGETEWKKVEEDELEKLNKLDMNINDKTAYFNAKVKVAEIDREYTKNTELLDKKEDKEEIKELSNKKKVDVIDTVLNLDLNDKQKEYLYSKYYSSEETLDKIVDKGTSMDTYLQFAKDTVDFESDEDEEGNTISGSKSNKFEQYLLSSNMSNDDKSTLYEYAVLSNFEDEDKYKTYKTIKSSGVDINNYLSYASQTFTSDKYANGKTVSNSRKNKVISYINSLDLTIPQKAIMIRTEYSSFKDYNDSIVQYVDGLSIDYSEKVKILENLDMTVSDNGAISWK